MIDQIKIATILLAGIFLSAVPYLPAQNPTGQLQALLRKKANAGASYTEEITDGFGSSGAPPTGWSEINGSWSSNGSVLVKDDATANAVAVSTSSTSTATQYVRVEYDNFNTDTYDGVVLRHDTGNVRYVVRYDQNGGNLHIRYCSGANAYTTFHTISSVTINVGDYLQVSVTGTDTSTEFKLWINPAGTTPDDSGGADYTINSGNWDGAPATYHNTGTGVGLYSGSTGNVVDFDNFSAGSK